MDPSHCKYANSKFEKMPLKIGEIEYVPLHIFRQKSPLPPIARGPHLPPLSSISPSSLATTIDAAGVVAVVILEMEVGPGCACVVVVERLVSEPASGAALCRRHRRAPRLRAGGSSCTASSSSLSPRLKRGRARRRRRRRVPRLRAGRPDCACVVVVEPLVSGRSSAPLMSSSLPARSRRPLRLPPPPRHRPQPLSLPPPTSFPRAARPAELRPRLPGRSFPLAVVLLGSPASMAEKRPGR